MDPLAIKQTYSVQGRTFDTEAEAQAYVLAEQRKRQAVEILSKVRRLDSRHGAFEVSNQSLVEIVAKHLEAFAEIVAVLNGEVG